MPGTKIAKGVSEPIISRYDSRNDLGYGRTSDKFHKPRAMGGAYPYQEKSDFDTDVDWEDQDTHDAIGTKVKNHQKTDPFSKKSVNPFYFAAGNTKLSDCFYRTDDVLKEVHSLSNSLVPIPGMIKNRKNFSGGSRTSSGTISNQNFRRTGSEKGYSSSPPEIKYDKNVNDDDEVIFNLEDLVKKLELQTGNFRSYGE